VSTTHASKIGESLESLTAMSVGKQGGRIHNSGTRKKLEGFFVRNFVKLVYLAPGRSVRVITIIRTTCKALRHEIGFVAQGHLTARGL
jgi:hypothetical protein